MNDIKKPNIIIINPDQWRGDMLGYLDYPAAKTRHLDQIIKNDGVAFTNAFSQATVCTPSRCSFMTGLYPHVHGHRTMHYMLHTDQGDSSILSELKKSDYYIWWGGKNDLIAGQEGYRNHCDTYFEPSKDDFQKWGYELQEGSHGGDLTWRGNKEGDNYYSFYKGKLDKNNKDKYFDDDWSMVYGALDFIEDYKNEKPFCLFLPLGYPHPPYCVEEPWYSSIDRNKVPDRYQYQNWEDKPSLLKGILDGQRMQKWNEEKWRELRAVYLGMCARVDYQFGLLIDQLKKNNLYDNSLIIFLSDHGDFTGDYGLVEKTQNTFQDCLTNVPLVIKPPKQNNTRNGLTDEMVELIDLAGTIYDYANIKPSYWHFSKSLKKFINKKIETHRDEVFTEGGRLRLERQASEEQSLKLPHGLYYPRVNLQTKEDNILMHTKATMCRNKDFKYIKRAYEKDEFYDLKKDPGEIINLIDNVSYKLQIDNLKNKMLSWYQETCDIVPLKGDERNFN